MLPSICGHKSFDNVPFLIHELFQEFWFRSWWILKDSWEFTRKSWAVIEKYCQVLQNFLFAFENFWCHSWEFFYEFMEGKIKNDLIILWILKNPQRVLNNHSWSALVHGVTTQVLTLFLRNTQNNRSSIFPLYPSWTTKNDIWSKYEHVSNLNLCAPRLPSFTTRRLRLRPEHTRMSAEVITTCVLTSVLTTLNMLQR